MNRLTHQLFTSVLCVLTIWSTAALAQAPHNTGTYYRTAHGKHGEALKTAFYNIIKNPSVLTYDDLWKAYKISDIRMVDGDSTIWDMYSAITRYAPDCPHKNSYEGSGINREHSFPKSWFGSIKPAYSDVVHVIPTDGYINNMRSDLPYGETDSPTKGSKGIDGAKYYSKVGACSVEGYTKNVFEPDDEYKGDLARIYFYMATCYEPLIATWTSDMLGGTSYQPFSSWALPMLMKWSEEDPVSQKETDRNAAIWRLQGNRNPFVDYPGLEEYLWGDLVDEGFSYDGVTPATEDQTVAATTSDIPLNRFVFGVDWSSNSIKNTRDYWERSPLTYEKDGITVIYNFGIEGKNMYANDSQIRLYQKNYLSFRTDKDIITSIDLKVVKNDNEKTFTASVGSMSGYTWTGNAREVQLMVSEGNGNVQLSGAHVEVSTTAIPVLPADAADDAIEAIYGLDGRRYHTLQPGLNIVRMKSGQVRKVLWN
jgi:endonuclease I